MIKQIILFCVACMVFQLSHADPAEHYEKASQAYSEKHFNEAYIHLKNTLQEDPEHLPGKILLGKFYVEKELYQLATIELQEALQNGADINLIFRPMMDVLIHTKDYQRALTLGDNTDLNQDNQFVNFLLKAEVYIALGRMPIAKYELDRANELFPNRIEVLNALIDFHLRNNQTSAAKDIAQHTKQLGKQNPLTLYLLGQIEQQDGDNKAAIEAYQQALKQAPDNPNIKLALAGINLKLGNQQVAEAMVDKALETAPNDPLAILIKSRLLLLNFKTEQASVALHDMLQSLSLASDEYIQDNPWVFYVRAISSYLLTNYEIAANELLKYIQVKPNDYNAVELLVDVYINLGQSKQAIDLMERYRKHADDSLNFRFALRLCDLYIATLKVFRCNKLLDSLEKSHPDSSEVLIAKAKNLVARSHYEEALALIKTAYTKEPKPVIGNYLAKLLLLTNQNQSTLVLVDRLLAQQQSHPELLNLKASALIKLNQFEQASEVLNQVLTIDRYYFPAIMNLANIWLVQGRFQDVTKQMEFVIKYNPPHAQASMLLAEAQARSGDLLEAINTLKVYQQARPDNNETTFLLVDYLSRVGKNSEALALLETNSQNDRFNDNYLTTKANLLFLLNDIERAREQHKLLYSVWRKAPEKLLKLSNMQKRLGDIGLAMQTVERALKLSPDNLALQLEWVNLAIIAKQFDLASEKLNTLKEWHPNAVEVLHTQGDLLLAIQLPGQAHTAYVKAFELSKFNHGFSLVKLYNLAVQGYGEDGFIRAANTALNYNPANHYFRNLLADFLLLKQQYDEARDHYLMLTHADDFPNQAGLYNNLALATQHQDLGQAVVYAKRAAELKSNSANIMDTYGWLLAQQNDYVAVLKALRIAFSFESQNPSIRYHLGYVLNRLNRQTEAVSELNAALSSKQGFAEREQAQQLLNALPKG